MKKLKNDNGITLIALIITIIVMLILVGVTINVAINGGLFEKAKTATIQTELEQIKEQLVLAKAEIIADNNGAVPNDYEITFSSLDVSDSIKTKYANKLIISQDGILYYTDNATAQDIVYFENAGITKLQESTPIEDDPVPVAQNPVIYGTDTDYIVVMPDNETAYVKLPSLGSNTLLQLSIEKHPITYFAPKLGNDSSNFGVFDVNTTDNYIFITNGSVPMLIYNSTNNNDCWHLSGIIDYDTVAVMDLTYTLYEGENSATILEEVNNYNS